MRLAFAQMVGFKRSIVSHWREGGFSYFSPTKPANVATNVEPSHVIFQKAVMLKLALFSFAIALFAGAGSFARSSRQKRLTLRIIFGLLLTITIAFLAVGLLAGEALF